MIAGANNPPDGVKVSKRRPREAAEAATRRSGKFLYGSLMDLLNMERAVGNQLENTLKDLEMEKSYVSFKIEKLFNGCLHGNFKPMLYYTRHGETGTGNWCFHDKTVSIAEIFSWCPSGMEYPTICSDTCFSGKWTDFAFEKLIHPVFVCVLWRRNSF